MLTLPSLSLLLAGDNGGKEAAVAAEDSWIGWHNDSGFVTALAGDMYVDADTGAQVPCPDPEAGLYVVDREGDSVRVDIPEDCMALQLGECVQVITGGALVATPHCVRGPRPGLSARGAGGGGAKVARIAHPCFIDAAPDFPLSMPSGTTRGDVLAHTLGASKVPPLGDRWTRDGVAFGDFLATTFSHYYDWKDDNSGA